MTYTDAKLAKIIEKIEARKQSAAELADGNPNSGASLISRARVRTYDECILLLEEEMQGATWTSSPK